MSHLNFYRYDIEIEPKAFVVNNELSYPQTAKVLLYNEQGRCVGLEKYGYLSLEELYGRIDSTGKIVLDNCYVHNFSITAYRRTRLIHKHKILAVDEISAKDSFFDSRFSVDFSYVKVNGPVNFSRAVFANGGVDFKSSVFSDFGIDFSNALFVDEGMEFAGVDFGNGELNFSDAKFACGLKNFQDAKFGKGALNFSNVDFSTGMVSFVNAGFCCSKVSFVAAEFGVGKLDFHFAKFAETDISFEKTHFNSELINFKAVEFGVGRINFNRGVFIGSEIDFEGSSLEGKLTFRKAAFTDCLLRFELLEMDDALLDFGQAAFTGGSVSFNKAKVLKVNLKSSVINCYIDARVLKVDDVDFSDTVIKDMVDIKPFDSPVGIKTFNISGVRLLGVINADWDENWVLQLIRSQKNTSLREKAEQFRVFKESFNSVGRYSNEDKAYLWFKRYQRNAKWERRKKERAARLYYEWPVHNFKVLVFDYMGLYATNPFRVMLSMLITYVLFSLLFVVVIVAGWGDVVSGIGGDHEQLGVLGRSFYHSGITFLTIGYGDFYPMGAMRWLSNVEGFIGVFLMSYFTVAFVRNILR